jgi:hypothetical protein
LVKRLSTGTENVVVKNQKITFSDNNKHL